MRSQKRGFGFHDGERAVQRQAGVELEAARLEGMLGQAELSSGLARFLGERSFAAIAGRDRDDRLWVSPLIGEPGFLRITDPTTLHIDGAPGETDPLHDMAPGQALGLIAIDYSRRRRFRLNGTLAGASPHGLVLTVEEAYRNCPQYIPQRTLDTVSNADRDPKEAPSPPRGLPGKVLTRTDRATIGSADTFLLGTSHPDRGNDASHRGGPPGFVRVDGATLWWPDYPGNNLFNSLGNLHTDPAAALLFLDFANQNALHLTGTAELVTVQIGSAGDDGNSGRRVVFTCESKIRTPLAAHSELVAAYSRNPSITS